MPGTYSLEVTDSEGCWSVVTYTVIDNGPCAGFSVFIELDTTGGISLSATTTGGTNPYAYLWSTNEVTSSITVAFGNSYGVTVTDNEGCVVEDEIQL